MKKTTIGLGVSACTLIVGGVTGIVVAAEQLQIQQTNDQSAQIAITPEIPEIETYSPSIAEVRTVTYFENGEYSSQFKISTDIIESITNNAGHYASQVITNAIDNNPNTYWETNKANTSNWNNEVEVTFTEDVTIDRIVFGARPDRKGFATQFEVYASPTSEGETFELITTGGHNSVTGFIEAQFEPTQMKRIKFKFVDSVQNWATLSELAFYKEDAVSDIVYDLFVDKTYTQLKPEYANKDVLEDLYESVQIHPANTELLIMMEQAFQIINGTVNESTTVITVNQDGDMNAHAKNTLSMNSAGQNYQATGVYGLPGEKITIYLDVEQGTKHLPKIGFSQNQGTWRGYVKTVELKPGRNEITVPAFDLDSGSYSYKPNPGGALYIINPYTMEQQGKAPKIRIDNAHDFPFYRQGDDEATFVEELKAYQEKLTAAQAIGDTSVLDLLEVESDRVLISTLASSGYQVFVTEEQSPVTTVNHWNNTFNALLEFNGLDGSSEVHDPKKLKEHVRVMQPYGFLYAYVCHVGIQTGHSASVLRDGFLNSWGMAHETGHRFDNKYRVWGEVTNNMEAMYASTLTGTINDRVQYEDVYQKIAMIEDNDQFSDGGYFVTLGAFWQLQMANDSYWADVNRLYRERRPNIPTTEVKNDTLVQYSSEVFGVNLTEHFRRHGLVVSEKTATELANTYPDSNKYWYLNTKAWEYTGTGLSEDDTASIQSISHDGKLTMITTASDVDLLGYEVLRDGEVIGFTRTNTFTDIDYKTDKNYEYTVIPYGANLIAGKSSDVHNSYTPTLTIAQQEVYIPLYETFNPQQYVFATDYQLESIRDKVVIESNVDAHKKGVYEVRYSITDQGITVEKVMKVYVLAQATPLSNLDWVTGTQQYSTPKKDINLNGKPLSLTGLDGGVVTYEKGLGTHANAELVYDISNDNYTRFQSYIGVEHDMSHRSGTVKFEVYVDGEKQYDSGVMKAGEPQQYLSVDVTGAKELKLVITDAGDGNAADHATWGNPILLDASARPELTIPNNGVYEVGSIVDESTLIGEYSAYDVEDGDVTDKVQITGLDTFTTAKPGNYEVIYTVMDSEGNTTRQTRVISVVHYADYEYLTDYEWTSAKQSYSSTQKDKHHSGSQLSLSDENGASVTYERGLGTHANAEIIYDLTQTDAVIFSTYVGVDRAMYNSNASSIIFEIYVDGEKKAATDVMRAKDAQQYLQVNISGAKELKLIVNDAGNGNGSDHGTFGDAKLHYVNEHRADLTQLQTLITELDALDTTLFTEESVASLQIQLEAAKALITRDDVVQVEADAMYETLVQAREQLEVKNIEVTIPDVVLRRGIMDTLGLASEPIMSDDLAQLEILHLEADYVSDLEGLQYATNLVSLNLNFNEVTDLRPLKELTKLVDLQVNENFLNLGTAAYDEGKFIIEPIAVFDLDGKQLEPTEVILSNGTELLSLPIDTVYVDGVVEIDARLLGGQSISSVEVKYASNTTAFSVYTFHWLELPKDVEANPIVEVKDSELQKVIMDTLNLTQTPLRASDLAKLTTLNLDGSYVRDLSGLEYAVGLTNLQLNYSEVTDLRPIKYLPKLTDLQAEENFLDKGDATFDGNIFTIQPTDVFDRNGQKLVPIEVVLSARNEMIILPLADVYVDGNIQIDATVLGDKKIETVEIMYASDETNFSVFTFHWLKK